MVKTAQSTYNDFPIREGGNTMWVKSTELEDLNHLFEQSNWGEIRPRRRDKKDKKHKWQFRLCKGNFVCKGCNAVYKEKRGRCCDELQHIQCEATLHLFSSVKINGAVLATQTKRHQCKAETKNHKEGSLDRKGMEWLGEGDAIANAICEMLKVSVGCRTSSEMPSNDELKTGTIHKLGGQQKNKPDQDCFWANLGTYTNTRPAFSGFKTQLRRCRQAQCKARLWYFSSLSQTYVLQQGNHLQGTIIIAALNN